MMIQDVMERPKLSLCIWTVYTVHIKNVECVESMSSLPFAILFTVHWVFFSCFVKMTIHQITSSVFSDSKTKSYYIILNRQLKTLVYQFATDICALTFDGNNWTKWRYFVVQSNWKKQFFFVLLLAIPC